MNFSRYSICVLLLFLMVGFGCQDKKAAEPVSTPESAPSTPPAEPASPTPKPTKTPSGPSIPAAASPQIPLPVPAPGSKPNPIPTIPTRKPWQKTDAETELLPVPPPINTTSPVSTSSPVKQDSSVYTTSPVSFFLRALPSAAVAVTALLDEQGESEQSDNPSLDTPVTEPAKAEPMSAETDTPANRSPGSRLRFNFQYAPWKDVIEWFAEQAGLSLQADNVPSGSLNLTDSTYYTPAEALDVLNSYLLFKEYTILRKGRSMFVIYLPDGIPPNLLEPITPAELDGRGKYEICRCVFHLDRTTPDVIQMEAEKLLGPQGSLVALPKSQQIVITETAGTLRAIRDIIRRIDDPDELAGKIHIIETKNLQADEALVIMRNLLGIAETDTSLRTSVDLSGTKIWMSGRGDMIERAKETIKTIDGSFASADESLKGEPQFDVYDVGTADPAAVLAVLQTLLAGIPDVRLSLDQKTGGIAALGRPANHATIRETIRQMQLASMQVEVIPLLRMSPLTAVESIKKFFATSTVDDLTSTATNTTPKPPGAPAPLVEADVSARQIVVRGTASQIKEIREYLAKLGESGISNKNANQATIRNIPLNPAAAALVLDQLKEIWPQIEQNEIKIVTPSAIVPAREASVDSLIDETFETEPEAGPVTQKSSTVRYQTVQHTTATPVAQTKSPVVVSMGPHGLMISSEDPEALNKLEELIQMLSDESVLGKTKLEVYRLKNSTAEVVTQTLQTLLGTGTTATLGVSGTGSVDTSATLDGERQAAVLGMLQLGSSIEKTGTVTITPDARLNALLVQANPVDHQTIKQLLPILDQADTANDIAIRSTPRLIPLYNIRAEEAKAVVESAFSDRIGSSNAPAASAGGNNRNQRQQPASIARNRNQPQYAMPMTMPGGMQSGMPGGMPPGGPGAMIQQLMSRLGGNQNRAAQEQEAKMTLAVETRSNSLIVTSPESLYRIVEEFVRNLDEIAVQSETAYEIVTLKHVSPDIARQTLGNVLGDSVTFTTTTTRSNAATMGGNRNMFGGNTGFGAFGGGQRNTFGGGMGGFGGGANPFMNIMRGTFGGAGGQRAFGGGQRAFGGGQRTGGFQGR